VLVRNEPQLITYVDRLGGDLRGLGAVLSGPFDAVFGGVHLLPFFHPIDGSDAGFDPIDHTLVDPRLGTWEELAESVGQNFDLMADLIVNHVSAQSPQFLDWAEHGADSEYDGMFITYDSVFPVGATEDDLLKIYRPRPGLCFTVKDVAGRSRLVWTTFTANQIDVNVDHPSTQNYFATILDRFQAAGVNLVRLDAVGYAVKKAGTASFMIPETFAFIEKLSGWCRDRGMEMLVEIHSYYRIQIEIAAHVSWVYDFALPPLVLDALFRADGTVLKHWLDIRPTNAITVLDTHDGIGVIDVGRDQGDHTRSGLLTQTQIEALIEGIHHRSNGQSREATGEAANNLDLYQVNCTFYDALGRDDDRYLMARLIQVLTPGVPQIYYVGALAGVNDMDLLGRTEVGRDINRHHYHPDEIDVAIQRPVVRRLLALLRWRKRAGALFDGRFAADQPEPGRLTMSWANKQTSLSAHLDLASAQFEIQIADDGAKRTITDLLDL